MKRLKRSTLRFYAYKFLAWRKANGGKVGRLPKGHVGITLGGQLHTGTAPVDVVMARSRAPLMMWDDE